jgi:signal transduction histidine kinase
LASLRSRLITWYITTGALVVLCLAALTAVLGTQMLAYQGHEALLSASRQVPALAAPYAAEHPGDLRGLDTYLDEHLAPLPVVTHTEDRFGAPHRGDRRGPPRGPFNTNIVMRLLMDEVRPMDVSHDDVRTLLFVAPAFYARALEFYAVAMLLVAAVVIVAAWRIAIVVAANSLDPLLSTTAALNRFGDGDFTPASVSANNTIEVSELAHAYNRAVEQITRALDERARASAEMRQFVADAGHQLRTPLTVIMGYLSSMATRTRDETTAVPIGKMLDQSRRMKTLIDELIVLARLEHAAPLKETTFDVRDVAREIPNAFAAEAQRRIGVAVGPAPVLVSAAESEFREALIALTDNAVKYAGGAPITIEVRRVDGWCEITVADRGIGFSGDDIRSGFDRFYRGETSEGTSGTGLGLSIAAKVVERAGGSIELRNRDDGGALCVIRLPIDDRSNPSHT